MRIATVILLAFIALSGAASDRVPIVPQPAHYQVGEGQLAMPEVVTVDGSMAADAVKYLDMRGLQAEVSAEAVLHADVDTTLGREAYVLQITPEGVTIKAAGAAGVMYAVETLTQLIDQSPGSVAACSIADSPRMAYRGMMLDVVRCYMPIAEIMRLVDVAAQLKLNTLHLHLTDDNGWRMQIDKYPRLTDVGAWRVDRQEIFPARHNARADEQATYGGYYTKDELAALVRYAADRNIEVIPEIEMPAHAVAAIAAYPQLACPVGDEFVGVLPGIGGKAASIIMCAGRDSTLQFVRDVLDEVMEVFPSRYIHLGGDEAEKSRWQACPLCQKRMRDQHLADCEGLQGWFMDQAIAHVRSHGRTAIGWDEVTYGRPTEDIVVMGWQGDGDVAVDYARQTGRPLIMTPANSTYLIRYQGPQWHEPFTYFGNITLSDAYDYEPVKDDWTDAMRHQLMGIQGSMWTEFCHTPSDVQYMMFPRLMAIADVAWRPEGERQWPVFVAAADNMLRRLDRQGINYARSMYNVQHVAVPDGNGAVVITAQTERPDAVIRVAGNAAMTEATVYSAPIVITSDTTLYLQAEAAGRTGQILALPLAFNKATGRPAQSANISNALAFTLTNGLHGSMRNSDFEWAGWTDRPASLTIDLGEATPIESVILRALGDANLRVAFPSSVQLAVSTDGIDFHSVRQQLYDHADCYPLQPVVRDIDFGTLSATARYIRVEATNPGPIPDGLPREGATTSLYFDEIIVR